MRTNVTYIFFFSADKLTHTNSQAKPVVESNRMSWMAKQRNCIRNACSIYAKRFFFLSLPISSANTVTFHFSFQFFLASDQWIWQLLHILSTFYAKRGQSAMVMQRWIAAEFFCASSVRLVTLRLFKWRMPGDSEGMNPESIYDFCRLCFAPNA